MSLKYETMARKGFLGMETGPFCYFSSNLPTHRTEKLKYRLI